MVRFLRLAVVDPVRLKVVVHIVNDQRGDLLQMLFEVTHLLVPRLLLLTQVIVEAVCLCSMEHGLMLTPVDAVEERRKLCECPLRLELQKGLGELRESQGVALEALDWVDEEGFHNERNITY